ncbi:unnamed protein product, partial [Allacma fusca]
TRVPMNIVRHQDVPLDGTAPAILHGYGGFSISETGMFSYSTEIIFFVKHFRGIYASANIRGGSEYGEKWHVGGMLLNKQNVFDDFEAAAEFLIKTNYTKSSKLTITGASNGGLLIGACVNQRPELYGAAIPQVGVMDMLRFQKFTHTIGSSSKQTNPLLLRVETNAGHGAGTPTSKLLDEKTDIYSFIAQNLGLEFNASN